ncbi:MAG: hypothetical protein JKY45_02880 [Emcibacter sp.]|nr:hypothetical protein [Emcibacter sp.]
MSSRVKFLLLILASFSGATALLLLFINTDYAQSEMTYFREYPYIDMTRRGITKIKPAPLFLSPKQKIPQETTSTSSLPQPEISVIAAMTQFAVATPDVSLNIAAIISALPAKNYTTVMPKSMVLPAPGKGTAPPQYISPENPSSPILTTEKSSPHSPPETGWRYDAKLGYEAYQVGNYQKAIRHFEHALILSGDHQDIRLQLAYAHKIAGQNAKAVENFKKAIDHFSPATAPFSLRREVEQLENNFNVNGYVIFRDESSNTQQLGADLTKSQAGMEVSYQPGNISLRNGRIVQIYARFLSGMEQDRLQLNPDSYQAGLGLRLKPLSDHNLVLSVERLVKVGIFARNDWMLRASYSLDYGTDYQQDKTNWWSYSLYLDAAFIDPLDPDIFLTAQFTGGYNIKMTESLILQPRITTHMTWQKDSFRSSSLIESGPGINMRYYFNDTKYEAFRSYIDLNLEYRVKFSGNSIGSSGPIVSLLLHF